MNKSTMKKRLEWCKKYQEMPLSFWENVLFTDETMIEINPASAMNRIRRFSFENPFQMKYISQHLKHPLKVMFQAGVSCGTKTNIIPCENIMNWDSYIEMVLDKKVKTTFQRCRNSILQQDNAPCHCSKKVKEYFRINDIQKIDWPPNSPDLNIIENVWRLLKLRINRTQIRNKNELIKKVKELWNDAITDDLIKKLTNSMPSRMNLCLKNKGGPSGY